MWIYTSYFWESAPFQENFFWTRQLACATCDGGCKCSLPLLTYTFISFSLSFMPKKCVTWPPSPILNRVKTLCLIGLMPQYARRLWVGKYLHIIADVSHAYEPHTIFEYPITDIVLSIQLKLIHFQHTVYCILYIVYQNVCLNIHSPIFWMDTFVLNLEYSQISTIAVGNISIFFPANWSKYWSVVGCDHIYI